ncbi:MAG: hypothetical protein RugAbin2_01448 [Rugosibacter sp.]|nr:hypothetical protein [Rugosibacter sp.]
MLNLMLNKRRPLLTKHAKGRIKARPLPASPARGEEIVWLVARAA